MNEMRPLGHSTGTLETLAAIERKLLWLSSWIIHNANHIRPNLTAEKVGGHQASCASVTSIMTALYFDALRPQDRVAVKPHASPVLHAVNYLLGRQSREKLELFRQFGGAQAYPSRAMDGAEIDFSTGSVGLGVAITSFSALIQDYVQAHEMLPAGAKRARNVAVAGDAELDEGNIYEALLEGWKHDVRDVWWVVDCNRQSLDSVMPDRLFGRFEGLFRDMGWRVVTLRYGRALQEVFTRPGGSALRAWLDDCPNSVYSALTFQGGPAWREALLRDIGRSRPLRALIDPLDDAALAALMTNLAGHDLGTLTGAFSQAASSDQPTLFLAHTIKGNGLPLAGHKDNHAGLMTPEQMDEFRAAMKIRPGHEWDRLEGLEDPHRIERFINEAPYAQPLSPAGRRLTAPAVPVPATLPGPRTAGRKMSTQAGFGEILSEIGRAQGESKALSQAIVTSSPDVATSTNLTSWINRRSMFARKAQEDVFRKSKVASMVRKDMHPGGQHIELGIAEQSLFLLLGAAGLAQDLYGTRLLPVGTVYDPFVNRGHDALYYACYQDARFLLVSTPSGITLAAEGGQHQATNTPLLGIVQDKLATFEPAYCDELRIMMRHAFEYMQKPDGSAVWLRLSNFALPQPVRTLNEAHVIAGAHWITRPAPGASIAIAYQGPMAAEAEKAFALLREDVPEAGLLAITSPNRLYAGWRAAQRQRRAGEKATSHIEDILAPLAPGSALVTVLDGHPAAHSWLGAVRGQRVMALGPDHFGQSGTVAELYREYEMDADAILDACAEALA
ncbi:transketolase [Acidocella facilis]|uniref:transketolase n=1 Tax=Acidocella facilis TaxID=525 RepID=UPI00047CA7F6|nr:transketolase [Acidocella facilis]